MMKNKLSMRCLGTAFLSGVFLCVTLCGCDVHDEALVLTIGETDAVETDTVDLSDNALGENLSEIPPTQRESVEETQNLIYVYVCGAVLNPGVVEIAEGSRADDALREAGGFTEDAARESVNLAAKVADGEMLYFPTITEAEDKKLAEEAAEKGLVNINTADAKQLMTLPGIGEAKAQDIITYREENGEFQAKEDLQKVPGIKENMYAKLSDKITIH